MQLRWSSIMLVALFIVCFAAGCSKESPAAPPVKAPEEAAQPEAPTHSPPATGGGPEEEAPSQLDGMTLDEKLGQLIIAGVKGDAPTVEMKKMLLSQHVGGIIFFKNNLSAGPKDVAVLVNQLKAWNKTSGQAPPLFFSVDQEGGRVSRLPGVHALPTARAIGKTNDAEFAEWIGSSLGEMCRLMGMNMNFAPVLDIHSNPANPVIGNRSFGTTAELVTRMGMSALEGIREEGVIPVVKHFPGHGDTAVDSHLDLPVIRKDLKALQAMEWLPFVEAIRQDVDVVMVGHLLLPELDPELPASLSKVLITEQLRGALGFKGVVVSDDMTMGAISKQYGMGEAAVLTIKAGGDLVMVAHEYENVTKVLDALKQSIQSGELTEERIDESVSRVLELKNKYKLSDEAPVQYPDQKLAALNEEIGKKLAAMGLAPAAAGQ